MTRAHFAILTAVVLACGYLGSQWLLAPLADPPVEPIVHSVAVPEGASLQEVAALLEERGLIRSQTGFRILGKLTGADRRIRPGEYALHPGLGPLQILSDMVEGRVRLHPVTIPEGFSVAQVAARLAEQGLAEEQAFVALTEDRDFIGTLDLAVPTLEGYLFPTTYHFPKSSNPREIIRTMVAYTRKAMTPELRSRAEEKGMSLHEVLTLASVIEKETGVASERPLISAVFHNRLRRGIPLQSDPTVIYALEAFDGNLRKRDLSVESPYNTYRVKGLPPGPIANPGAESIAAALHPAKAPYLYFVSRNDGTHHFSSTLAEHNQAVDKYQRRISRRVS